MNIPPASSALSNYLTLILLGIFSMFMAIIQFSKRPVPVTKRLQVNIALIVFAPYTIGFLLKAISNISVVGPGPSLVLMSSSVVGIVIMLSILHWGLGDLTIYNADPHFLLDSIRGTLIAKGIAFTEKQDNRLSSIEKRAQSKPKHYFDLTGLPSTIVVTFEDVPKAAIIRVKKRQHFPDYNDLMLNIKSAIGTSPSNSNSASNGVFLFILALVLIVTGLYFIFFK